MPVDLEEGLSADCPPAATYDLPFAVFFLRVLPRRFGEVLRPKASFLEGFGEAVDLQTISHSIIFRGSLIGEEGRGGGGELACFPTLEGIVGDSVSEGEGVVAVPAEE